MSTFRDIRCFSIDRKRISRQSSKWVFLLQKEKRSDRNPYKALLYWVVNMYIVSTFCKMFYQDAADDEARVAATLTNLAKQAKGLQTLAYAQVALADVFLKYVITCVVESPEDALPAARVRARLRYEKLVRAAAEGISNKDRDTLKGLVADE